MRSSKPLKSLISRQYIAPARLVVISSNCKSRGFHSTTRRCTDGVYQELTSMRVKTPYIDALRRQQKQSSAAKGEDSKSSAAAQSHIDLTPKKMSDSYHRVILPLARDKWLLDNYINVNGHLRLGAIFMDLDALAGVCAYLHTGDAVMTVTAAVDRITLKHQLKELCDLELSGQVTFATGRSSMEISLQVAKAPKDGEKAGEEDVLLTCAFTMVSLDPSTKRPVAISPLQIETAEERRLFSMGEKNYNAKKSLAKTALRKMTPNDEESDLIHAMWLKQLEYYDPNNPISKPENVTYMETSKLHSTQIMQPQARNRHNFMIFGGFLLKQTFELAFTCAASFSHKRPTFISLDPSTFENPVPVGSVLYLTATVAYTEENSSAALGDDGSVLDSRGDKEKKFTKIQVRVDSRVRNVEHEERKPTGQFNYTFIVEKDISVMPRSYSEFMIWVDARRRCKSIQESLGTSSPTSVGEGIEKAQGHDGNRERVTE